MLYTPSGGKTTGFDEVRSPYADSPYTTTAGQFHDKTVGTDRDVQQYNSEFGPGLGRLSPSQLAWSLTWVNIAPFVYVLLGLALACLVIGSPETLVGAGYAVAILVLRTALRYLRYSSQAHRTYALG